MDLQVTQAPDSNSLTKTWTTVETKVPCLVEPIKTISASEKVSGKSFKDIYAENDYFRLTLGHRLSKRQRITNVRDSTGDVIMTELEVVGEPSTEFEIVGEEFVFTPFGKAQQFTYMVGRVAVQNVR